MLRAPSAGRSLNGVRKTWISPCRPSLSCRQKVGQQTGCQLLRVVHLSLPDRSDNVDAWVWRVQTRERGGQLHGRAAGLLVHPQGFYLPIRAALTAHGPLPAAWYGQQESYWIAYYDVLRRLGLARYRPADNDHLDGWAALAQSCGWWWPGEDMCVIVERPAAIHTQPIPGGWHEQVQLHHGNRPPVEYRDGWRPPLKQPDHRPRPGNH
jgi:hypothetical protein